MEEYAAPAFIAALGLVALTVVFVMVRLDRKADRPQSLTVSVGPPGSGKNHKEWLELYEQLAVILIMLQENGYPATISNREVARRLKECYARNGMPHPPSSNTAALTSQVLFMEKTLEEVSNLNGDRPILTALVNCALTEYRPRRYRIRPPSTGQ